MINQHPDIVESHDTDRVTEAFAGLRYDLSLQVDNDQRKNAKVSASLAATTGIM